MTIGFYISNIKHSDGGIYQYTLYVLQMLINCDSVKKIYLFINNDQKQEFADYLAADKVKPIVINLNSKINHLLRQTSEFWLNRFYLRNKPRPYCQTLYRILNPERRFLNKFKIDLLHITRQHAPAYELKFPVIVTMHDVQQMHFPEFFTPLQRIHKAITYHVTIREADQIIVSYDHVKNDLIKYFRTEPEKINVCPVPHDKDWLKDEATNFDELKNKYNLPEQYILTPAATWEHKNHLSILETLNILRGKGLKIFWVSTGLKTEFYPTIEKRIKELGLENQVCFTDIVSDKDLKGLYENANLVVMPTLYEAGSGPLIEAMRYEIPVICSNVTSLPEMIGNIEFVFSPRDSMHIARLIESAFTDPDFVKRNRENSRKQFEIFRKQDFQNAFIETYKKAIQINKLSATQNYKSGVKRNYKSVPLDI